MKRNRFDISDFVNTITEERTRVELTERFRERRKELGLTQRDIAQRSGVSYASIRRFETTGDISLTSLLKLANAIDCLWDFKALFAQEKIRNLKDY